MTYAELIKARRSAVQSDWQTFVKQPSYLNAGIVDRGKAGLPSAFFPWAPGVVIASNYLLQAAGHHDEARCPPGWAEKLPDVFTKVIRGNRLEVRGCAEFWTIERQYEQALVLPFGPLPVFTRTAPVAMRVAEYCHPEARTGECQSFPAPRGVATTLRWVVSAADGVLYVS